METDGEQHWHDSDRRAQLRRPRGNRRRLEFAIVNSQNNAVPDQPPQPIDEEMISRHLYTAGLPDPDLLIRTSGEMRVSNFLLWQIAYAEIYVTETLWPDFDDAELHRALLEFQSRERRYGGLSSEDSSPDPE